MIFLNYSRCTHTHMSCSDICFAIVTVSDRCSSNECEDLSGPLLIDLLKKSNNFNAVIPVYHIKPDDSEILKSCLLEIINKGCIDVILTTGGTGCSKRDITPEATKQLIEKECPGIVYALLARSLQATPLAALSRLSAGITGNTLVVNLPGSSKAVKECLQVLDPILLHAVQLIRDNTSSVSNMHKELHAEANDCGGSGSTRDVSLLTPGCRRSVTFNLKGKDSVVSQNSQGPPISVTSCSEGRVGIPVHFIIDVSLAGSGDLQVTVLLESNEVDVSADSIDTDGADQNQYDVYFVPAKEGVYTVSILYNDQHVSSSPFTCVVSDGTNNMLQYKQKKKKRFEIDENIQVSKVVLDPASRPRKSPYPLISVQDAEEIVLACASKVVVGESMGRVLAEDVLSATPFPPFNASIKDGYAVKSSDGDKDRTVVDSVVAGVSPSKPIKPSPKNGCVRVSTGAPIPAGYDAVIQVEDTVLIDVQDGEERVIRLNSRPKKGQDIRRIGCDIGEGELVLGVGSVVGAGDIGLVTSLGLTHLLVTTKPIVGVLSTGNEIVDINTSKGPLPYGKIWDTNRPQILALLGEHSIPTFDAGIAVDQPDNILEKLCHALRHSHVLVTSGGVSMGEKDLLKQVLEIDLGFQIRFGRVFMKPGKPTTFATGVYDGAEKLVFGLPGNPVSSWVTTHLYVLPAVRMVADIKRSVTRAGWTAIYVKIDRKIELDDRPEYHRATLVSNTEDTDTQAYPMAVSSGLNQISSRLLNTRAANLLLKLPSKNGECTSLAKNSVVKALVIAKI